MLNLFFTVQYHWPISRLNYCLQLGGLAAMMCIFITTFRVILSTASQKSKQWPYMLDYVAVGATTLLIRGYDPLLDAAVYADLIRLVHDQVGEDIDGYRARVAA